MAQNKILKGENISYKKGASFQACLLIKGASIIAASSDMYFFYSYSFFDYSP